MESTIINATIAAAAAIVGGCIAAAASYINTRHKLKEMELAASQKLRENYLQNAREYTRGIYVPLILAVSHLYDAYNAYQGNASVADRRQVFVAAIQVFLSEVRRLRDSGAEAFLTNELEDRLRHFSEFLTASVTATEVRRKAVIGYHANLGGLAFAQSNELTLTGKRAAWLRSPKVTLSFFGMGVTYEAEVLLGAPLDSVEFNKRFVSDSSEIRILVKEVTLGGKPQESSSK
jgi:hypothetical protein